MTRGTGTAGTGRVECTIRITIRSSAAHSIPGIMPGGTIPGWDTTIPGTMETTTATVRTVVGMAVRERLETRGVGVGLEPQGIRGAVNLQSGHLPRPGSCRGPIDPPAHRREVRARPGRRPYPPARGVVIKALVGDPNRVW